jgi:glucan biosynthesis protein
MRTETKTIKIYNFDELNEDIRKKLIEQELENQYEMYLECSLYNDMKEKASELLKKYFKNNNAELKDVYYSLSYCQGDGAMFEFDLYYYNKYVKIKHHGHYYHKYSFFIDTWELTEKQENQLKEKVLKMFEEFEEYGWKLVDIRNFTEADAIEYLKSCEYLEDGSIYY